MELSARIGILHQERLAPQRISVSVEAELYRPPINADDISETLSYDIIAAHIKAEAQAGHINLVETLAANIARACLCENGIRHVKVRIEKPDIYETGTPGVELFLSR